MKTINRLFRWAVLALSLVQPLGSLLGAPFGYDFFLTDYRLYILIMTLSYAVTVVCSICSKDQTEAKCTLLLPLLTVISWLIFLQQRDMTVPMMICMAVSVLLAGFLALRHAQHVKVISVCVGMTAILFFFGIFLTYRELISFGSQTVVMTADCPNGIDYVEVVAYDYGALDGYTQVHWHKKGLYTPLFRYDWAPGPIWQGRYDAYETLEVYWKDDCLVINGEEYLYLNGRVD